MPFRQAAGESRELVLAEVTGTIHIEKAAILEVTVQHLSNGRVETFRTTDEHPFWVEKAADGKDGTFRPADRLIEGDSITVLSGDAVVVSAGGIKVSPSPVPSKSF